MKKGIRLPYSPVNFLPPENTTMGKLMAMALMGYSYSEVRKELAYDGKFITVKQYDAACVLINEQLNLDIGCKQHLLGRKDDRSHEEEIDITG